MKFRNTEPYPLLFRKYSLKKQCFLVLPLCHICPFRLKLINDINDMRYSQADIVDIERVLLTIWAPTIENEVIEVLIRNGDALPCPISQSCVTNRTEVAAGELGKSSQKCHKEKQDVTNSSPVKTVLESLSHSNVRESKQVLKIWRW